MIFLIGQLVPKMWAAEGLKKQTNKQKAKQNKTKQQKQNKKYGKKGINCFGWLLSNLKISLLLVLTHFA